VVGGEHSQGVVVVDDLSPAEVLAFDTEAVTAVAVAAGAPLSHAAILVRSRGIPAVTGLGPQVLDLAPGTVVLVDGDTGRVHVDPGKMLVERARARRDADRRRAVGARRNAAAAAVTRDGQTVPVLVNVGRSEDARAAVSEGADGVGMLRTEFAFLGRREPPGEDEQYEAYRRVAEAMGERPLVIRTLDLGADIPAWSAAPEANPALGNRGIRLSLSSRDLLEPQLRAVARLAAERPVQLMFPMVTTVEELRQARACLDEVAPAGVRLDVGITVEVPAAAVTADAFAPLVDFFAIGTNDLTQYTLAVDRSNAAVAGLADGLQPAVLRLIAQVTAAGRRHGRPVEVVGELGCDPLAIPILLGLGVDTLSVRPNAVAVTKQAVREVAVDAARTLAEAALEAESAAAVRALATQYWAGVTGGR
jgi:phosphocarrier protein FPr